MIRIRTFALALLAGAPLAAAAVDAPHDASNLGESGAGIDCKSCHTLHSAPGASLTSRAGNFNLCQSCHTLPTVSGFGFPWSAGMQAVPGVSGTSHRWDSPTSSGGATPPDPASVLGKRTPGGVLQCSTCHNPHSNGAPGRMHTSIPVSVPQPPTTGGAGRTMTLEPPGANALARGYRMRVCTDATTFQLSHDRGISWKSFVAGAWVNGSLDASCKPTSADGGQPILDDPAVRVTFAGPLVAGDVWDFYVAYPLLRVDNTASAMCVQCHPDRVMDHARASGEDPAYPVDGVNVFSHPVGVALGANGMGYDRATPLDANGMPQSAANDASDPAGATNNIELASGNVVHCLSCHRPHNADSNSLTADP